LAPASNKKPGGRSIAPPPWWHGEENGKKKAKPMGRDKDSLTEEQRKQITTIWIRRIYKKPKGATLTA